MIDIAAQMDDARATESRKAFAGCEDKTWAAWKSAMATVPAKKYEGMHDDREHNKSFLDTAITPITTNPSTYLASIALVTCMTVGQDKPSPTSSSACWGKSSSTGRDSGAPAPPSSRRILTAGVTLDDREAKIEYPIQRRPFGRHDVNLSGGGEGVIAKLKPSGKTVTVEFKKQMVKQVQCAETKRTNRVTQILSNGTLIYELICLRNETVTVNKASDPVTVNARYLEGVQPGMHVLVIEDVATAVWAETRRQHANDGVRGAAQAAWAGERHAEHACPHPFRDRLLADPEHGNGRRRALPCLLTGETIGRYQIKGLLGAGGMGQVFTALDLELGRTVALKLVPPDLVASARARVRLLREAQALARLQHPNVVAIYDVGTEGDQVVHGDGAHRRVDARRVARGRRSAVARRPRRLPRRRAGSGGGARGRDRPPRLQAEQRDGREPTGWWSSTSAWRAAAETRPSSTRPTARRSPPSWR